MSYRPIGKPVTPIEQGNLFSAQELTGTYTAHRSPLDITAPALIQWKTRVIAYQQSSQVKEIASDITQGNLFDLTPTQPELNPFTLPRQNTQFWRWKPSDVGVSALYFVIDYECNLLLYIGETVKSDSR